MTREHDKEMGRESLLTVEELTLFGWETGLSFSIPQKGIHGVLGPVGAGKGELLSVLAGAREARSGRILLGGEALSPDTPATRGRIGYVPAACPLVGSMTVLETLELAGKAKGVDAGRRYQQIKEALSLLGLEERKKRLVSRLSTGERWRLTMAMALLGNPSLLLVEDPLRPLGEDTRESRIELLTMLGRVKTLVISTDSFSLARRLCEDVLILSDGQLLARGSFEELEETLASNGGEVSLEEIYRQLCAASRKRAREEVAE